MQVYYGLVHVEPGSAYGVTLPDLPGCFSAADDEGDIVAEAQTALALYASDRDEPLPASRPVTGNRRRDEVRPESRHLSDRGAVRRGVPQEARQRHARPRDPGVTGRCARIAGVSRSQFVSDALAARVADTTRAGTDRNGKAAEGRSCPLTPPTRSSSPRAPPTPRSWRRRSARRPARREPEHFEQLFALLVVDRDRVLRLPQDLGRAGSPNRASRALADLVQVLDRRS